MLVILKSHWLKRYASCEKLNFIPLNSSFLVNQDGELSFLLCRLLLPSRHRGQGWLPVILALRVNVCCSVSTSIKLFLSCSAVTESTAHDCHPRSLYKSRRLGNNVHMCVCVCMCLCVNACVTSLPLLRVTIRYKERSFCSLDPGNANGFAKRFAGKWGIEEPFHPPVFFIYLYQSPSFPIPWEDVFMDVSDFHLDVKHHG